MRSSHPKVATNHADTSGSEHGVLKRKTIIRVSPRGRIAGQERHIHLFVKGQEFHVVGHCLLFRIDVHFGGFRPNLARFKPLGVTGFGVDWRDTSVTADVHHGKVQLFAAIVFNGQFDFIFAYEEPAEVRGIARTWWPSAFDFEIDRQAGAWVLQVQQVEPSCPTPIRVILFGFLIRATT